MRKEKEVQIFFKTKAVILKIQLREASVLCSSDYQTNSSGLETFIYLKILIKLLKIRNFTAFYFSWKPLETESLAVVHFVIDSCSLVCQPNYFNNSNNDCDWHILACSVFQRVYNNPNYCRILIGSRLWSLRGQMHDWRHHYKVFSLCCFKMAESF